jgi:tetratricopeptide (TPR) repeat protein
LESLVVARGPTRRDDARWLFEWKLAHAEEGYRVQILLGWARAEEESLGDPKSALEIYRRVLLLDDDDADALTATSRLALTLGDVEGALSALTVRRDRSEGGARATLDLEIAKILLDATNRYNDALACVRGALDAMPTDAGAIGLAARLLAIPSTSASIVEALDRAIEASDDPESRARILSTLLEGPKDAAPGDARLRWYDRLLDLHEQRAETEAEIALIARAANELPLSEAIWDRAERIARTVQRPDEVATLYERALYGSLAKSDAMALAQRAVAFYEEWFDAPARIVTILERVLDIDPTAEWAFDRLKLLFDAAERWDDLFALFDRALEAVRGPRRVELLEDAAQIAKDFAGRPDRATGYLEQLLVIHPNDARLSASLERLYERQSRHRELVALLSARAPTLAAAEAHATRARIASLWVDDLKDPAAALGVVEEILDLDASAQPQAVTALLERILGAAPLGLEMPAAATVPPRGSEPPPKSRRASTLSLRRRSGRRAFGSALRPS